jgi:hypothetical protein
LSTAITSKFPKRSAVRTRLSNAGLEQKQERRKVDQLSGRRSEPSLNETERRKLRILSAIFSETEKLGHAVKDTRGEVYFEIGGQRLDYKVCVANC